jgi:hypothetical protein
MQYDFKLDFHLILVRDVETGEAFMVRTVQTPQEITRLLAGEAAKAVRDAALEAIIAGLPLMIRYHEVKDAKQIHT